MASCPQRSSMVIGVIGRTTPAAPLGHGRRPQPAWLSTRFRCCPAAIKSADGATAWTPALVADGFETGSDGRPTTGRFMLLPLI